MWNNITSRTIAHYRSSQEHLRLRIPLDNIMLYIRAGVWFFVQLENQIRVLEIRVMYALLLCSSYTSVLCTYFLFVCFYKLSLKLERLNKSWILVYYSFGSVAAGYMVVVVLYLLTKTALRCLYPFDYNVSARVLHFWWDRFSGCWNPVGLLMQL